ncbi:MAG: putative DNA-binding domain-containing protein [Burkholderiales bacterium]
MMGALASFQDEFVRALLDPEAAADGAVGALVAQPAFAVYRNTVIKACIDALQANFPAVARLVGDEWFRSAAAAYARSEPPAVPMMSAYGSGFPGFLERHLQTDERAYLPAVARLDLLWTECHCAPDALPLAQAALAQLQPQALGVLRLRPHPATRWAWFSDAPAYSIWSLNRGDPGPEAAPEIDWRGEGVLFARPLDAVISHQIGEPGCAFLDACAAGESLADAAQAALGVDAGTDLGALMARLLEAGAFAGGTTTEELA